MLIKGDCLEELKKLDDNSVDLIFADLPYIHNKKPATNCRWNTEVDLDKLWKELKRVRKDRCPAFFTTTTKYGVDLIMSNRKEFRFDLVWVKSNSCGFLGSKLRPLRSHEMVYMFAKNGYTKNGAYDISSHKHKFKNKTPETSQHETCYSNITIPDFKGRNGGSRYSPPLPTSVLRIKSTMGKHKTEKPVELMKWILKYYSKEGSVVLDPTMGSGSMGVACEEMKRQFIGIELDDKIFEVAKERILKKNKKI